MNTTKNRRDFVTLQDHNLGDKKGVFLHRISKIIKELKTNTKKYSI